MLRLMIAHSRPHLIITAAVFAMATLLIVTDRAPAPDFLGGNFGWPLLIVAAGWLLSAALNAARYGK